MRKPFLFTLAFIILLLFLSGCDKFDLDFTTKSNFSLNASSHEFDVKTKQENPFINYIVVNGLKTYLLSGFVINEEHTTTDFDGFSVNYRYGAVEEIMGEWFYVKVIDGYTTHITIDENKTGPDRSLYIELIWRSANNCIDIKQSK